MINIHAGLVLQAISHPRNSWRLFKTVFAKASYDKLQNTKETRLGWNSLSIQPCRVEQRETREVLLSIHDWQTNQMVASDPYWQIMKYMKACGPVYTDKLPELSIVRSTEVFQVIH